MQDPLLSILKQTNSKSVEYEINKIAVKYFNDYPKLYNVSVDNIKQLINY